MARKKPAGPKTAEQLPYWKTSKSDAGAWLRKAEAEVERYGGTVTLQAKGRDGDRAAFLLDFQFDAGDGSPVRFRAIWPITQPKGDDQAAAERQAATMLFHDVKSRALRVELFGFRQAFFDFLLLPDGRTAGQLAAPDLADLATRLLPPARI